ALMPTRRLLILGLASLVAACSPQGPPPGQATTPAELTRSAILSAINGVRKANGRPPLSWNVTLASAARTQADLMAARDRMSHTLGGTLHERMIAAGYHGATGENLAAGQRTLEQAIQGWLDSPGHRATLLSDRFTEFGLAATSVASGRTSRYGIYWAFIAGGSYAAWLGAP
ncbi:MAG TPA: CAP domain-containing protein, partial [Alphaproteobacteria bacterium]|nr:CAP domain-containing protein [Alphaproteobacteria bacterium]